MEAPLWTREVRASKRPGVSQKDSAIENLLEKTIFASRWLQAPLTSG